jgi:hypothetical protein
LFKYLFKTEEILQNLDITPYTKKKAWKHMARKEGFTVKMCFKTEEVRPRSKEEQSVYSIWMVLG